MNDSLYSAAAILGSYPSHNSLPKDTGIEIAFAGRSNAGKSSVLNVLLNQKNLARTSSSPGKTRHINLFTLGNSTHRRLVDLPGYGYAKVGAREQERWGQELTRYIIERNCLKGVVIVMDIRHVLTERDKQMVSLCRSSGKAIHILLNKCDKLKNNQKNKHMKNFESKLGSPTTGCTYSIFSAAKKIGIGELQSVLNLWFGI